MGRLDSEGRSFSRRLKTSMCGILGYSHISRELPPGVLTLGLNSLVHRGPDHQGRFVSDQISLGATRLRILDLEAGDQPLLTPDKDVVVVFNGEIFNQREIRAELEAEGFRFRTHCDTEVVLHAFRRWGSACFSRFRGMFAIAVWVQSERRLVLARDRMGIKPLYYYLHDGEIYFGSELKCIFAHPDFPRTTLPPGLELLSQPQLCARSVYSGQGHCEGDARSRTGVAERAVQHPLECGRSFAGASVFA